MAGVVLVAAAGGCTSDEKKSSWNAPSGSAPATVAGSAPPWTEPANYGFVLTRGCDDAKPLGKYQVTVKAGAVSGNQRLDASAAPAPSSTDEDLGPVTGQSGEEIETPTLGELVAMAQTATDDGGQVTTVYAADGHPAKVVINVSEEGPSGAECWSISDYQPA
ncbi:MAG: hypothetical protein ABW046_08710 [Actinoplanes sp.]